MSDAARITYFKWLAREHPQVFKVASKSFSPGLSGLGWIAALINGVIQAGSVVLQKKQQDQQLALAKKAQKLSDAQAAADRADQLKFALLEINTKRASAGLGPVDLNGNLIQGQSLPTPAALAPFVGQAGGVPIYVWVLGAGAALLAIFSLRR